MVPRYRHEYKYLCSNLQMTILQQRMQGLLLMDRHAMPAGYYRIRSLYFDTQDDMCYYDNENGVGSRCKYRIRIYNGDKSCIVLEKKVKENQMGYKLSCRLSEAECRLLIQGRYEKLKEDEAVSEGREKIKRMLFLEMQQLTMRPKVIVEYMRIPFVEPSTNVRVTFDKEISSSNDFEHFLESQIPLRPVNPLGEGIMEVKWDGILPDYIRKSLQLNSLSWTGYSKYYFCRKYNMYGGVRV